MSMYFWGALWYQSTEEKKPKPGERVLVGWRDGDIEIGWWSGDIWSWKCTERDNENTTAPDWWMPLPSPPTKEDEW